MIFLTVAGPTPNPAHWPDATSLSSDHTAHSTSCLSAPLQLLAQSCRRYCGPHLKQSSIMAGGGGGGGGGHEHQETKPAPVLSVLPVHPSVVVKTPAILWCTPRHNAAGCASGNGSVLYGHDSPGTQADVPAAVS